jgi:hypothetical protein
MIQGKHKEKEPVGRSGCRHEDNIKMEPRESSLKDSETVDWIQLV